MDPVAAQALDLLFILHADHEQNASTSTVRLAGSTGANPYAAISAGVSALWGPAHGGANEAVLAMLEQIGTVDNIPKYLAMAKDKTSHFRLMGFGHRVYKNFDPRAKIIREMCHKVLAKLGSPENPLFELALRLEEVALKDEYFVSRKLYPNVDFYSGMIYSALGIPRSMFTVMFAIARTVGWVAHWQEMIADPNMRIGRPRQLYTGSPARDYADISTPQGLIRRQASSASRSATSARRIGLPSTGLTGAWRMPSVGNTVASIAWSSTSKRTPGYSSTRSAFIFTRRVVTSWRMPWSISQMRHRLRTLREQMQLHVRVLGGRAAQHRTDQPRGEPRQLTHGPQRRGALRVQGFGVGVAAEQALVFHQGHFDLGVLRQHCAVGDAVAFGGLALGDQEVADAVLGHDSGGFLREGVPQVLTANAQSFWHAPIIWPRPEKIKREKTSEQRLAARRGLLAGRPLAIARGGAAGKMIDHEGLQHAVGIFRTHQGAGGR